MKTGTVFGPYEIVSALGKGGMGEVWRARDPKLHREVAIKLLPERFATDPARLVRFEREAQTLASLNHANIATIYGLEQVNGVLALVLELVEGQTLQECIAKGPIPLEECLDIAFQIAEALEAAHQHGIIHRDLKPANIKIRPDGTVKILDFGLAKAITPEYGESDLANSPTISLGATQAGVLLGTAAYMSPEQVKARAVDRKVDIWAFGCVLYEMLTGRRAFEGADISETLATVLKSDLDWSALPPETPVAIRRLLRRTLTKDARNRLSDIGVARLEIAEARTEEPIDDISGPTGTARKRPIWWIAIPVIAIAGLAALITALSAWLFLSPAASPIVRFTLPLPPGDALVDTGPTMPGPVLTLSPDGSVVVYAARRNNVDLLFRRQLDEIEPTPISGTEGARFPFFSPDGQWLGFQAGEKLKKIPLAGGLPVEVCSLPVLFQGASWSSDGRIFFCGGDPSGLWVVPDRGGIPQTVAPPTAGEASLRWPYVLPGADGVLLTSIPSDGGPSQLVSLSLETGEKRRLLDGTHPRWASTGHLLFSRDSSIWVVPFDSSNLSLTGDAVPVLQGVNMRGGGNSDFAVASNGNMVYLPGGAATLAARTLVWVDRQGREEVLTAPPRGYVYPRISPDGSMLAVQIVDQENDIWIWDFQRSTLARLTFDPGLDQFPVWTQDSRRIIYASQKEGLVPHLYWRRADGSGDSESLARAATGAFPNSVTPDGKHLIYLNTGDLFLLTLGDRLQIRPLLQQKFIERNAEVSPDGRWLAYQSSESGRDEIYVRPYPNVNQGRWQVSTDGATRPLWSRDGGELFFLRPDRRLMSVTVMKDASAFTFSAPQQVFGVNPQHFLSGNMGTFPGRTYDVSPDGQRFLLMKLPRPLSSSGSLATNDDTSQVPYFVVTLNWFEELKRLAP